MRPLLFVFSFSLLLFRNSSAQSFLKFYVNPPDSAGVFCTNIPTSLTTTPDGGFCIGGYSCTPDSPNIGKMQIRKVDANGNLLWDKQDHVSNGYDEIDDLVYFDDTTIYCAIRLGQQAGICKRNKDGGLIWAKNLFPIPDTCTGINSLIKTSDNNLLFCGTFYPCGGSGSSILIAKTDTGGVFLWQRVIEIPYAFGSGAFQVIESVDSFYLIAGYTGYIDTNAHVDIPQFFLAKYNPNGQEIFFKTYGTSQLGFQAHTLAYLPDSKIAVAGSCVYPPNFNDGFLALLNDTGKLLNIFIDTIPKSNLYWKVKADHNYAYLIESTSRYYPSDTAEDIKLLRYSINTQKFDLSRSYTLLGSQEGPYDMEILADGSIAILFTESDSLHFTCAGLVLLDSTGCVPDWCATYIKETDPKLELSVFPNPFHSSFMIRGAHRAQITIFNLMGNVIAKKSVTDNEPIYLSQENPPGIYFVQVTTPDNTVLTAKLIYSPY